MMRDAQRPSLKWTTRNGLVRVALWQFLAFLILILLIWVDHTMDLSGLWFSHPEDKSNVFTPWVLSVAVVITAIIVVGHTYEQEKRIIRGMLTVCSYCHKVRVSQDVWEQMDQFVTDHSLALITHGMCPDCYDEMQANISRMQPPASPGSGKPAPHAHDPHP